MPSEAHYEAALNYFYFLLMDEGSSLQCALRTVRLFQKKLKRNPNLNVDQLLISVMSAVLHQAYKKQFVVTSSTPKSDWKTPNSDTLASWREYLKRSEPDSAEALVLRHILGYPVKVISEALSVPEGTIYFRLGRGLEVFSAGKFS
jgi:DNA-directed RNA polymerase specialized sigma24 family protein